MLSISHTAHRTTDAPATAYDDEDEGEDDHGVNRSLKL